MLMFGERAFCREKSSYAKAWRTEHEEEGSWLGSQVIGQSCDAGRSDWEEALVRFRLYFEARADQLCCWIRCECDRRKRAKLIAARSTEDEGTVRRDEA